MRTCLHPEHVRRGNRCSCSGPRKARIRQSYLGKTVSILLEVKEAGQTVLDVGGCQVVDGSSGTHDTQAGVQSTIQSTQSSIAISHPGVGAVADNGIVAAIVVLADTAEPSLAQVAGLVSAAEQTRHQR